MDEARADATALRPLAGWERQWEAAPGYHRRNKAIVEFSEETLSHACYVNHSRGPILEPRGA
jgi:hypothetical protein